jgi:EAL domain-containing protein (putative c-di-GMP-specific phosphodiesterase class I)
MQGLKEGDSLSKIAHSIYAFESLVRINKNVLQGLVGEEMSSNVDYLNPAVLFARAEEVNIKLELDQACFKLAMENFKYIPGKLLVNILPRNFYFIEDLRHSIPKGVEVIFEVSETEAINNMSLIQSIRDKISESSHGIAIDDFGKGYAGVDRIIKIQPTIIKLDQILINQIDKDVRMQAFIKGLVEAARSTHSLVLAEGIETKEELITLAEIGIDLVQGFFLHKPQPREVIMQQIKKNRRKLKSVA